jgi:hypothetical protein
MEPKFEIKDVEWAKSLEKDFDQYMNDLVDSLDGGEEVDTYSGLPFCECSTCYTREVISFLTVHILRGSELGKVVLLDS